MHTNSLEAYVDGSFCESGISGAVVLPITSEEFYFFSSEPSLLVHRNVSGEVLATLLAVTLACRKAITDLTVVHDYVGLSEWYYGRWKARSDLSKFYVGYLKQLATQYKLDIHFQKVRAHAGNPWNDRADKLAKHALKLKESNVDVSQLITAFKKYAQL